MLKALSVAEVKHIAGIAKATRSARDEMLDKVRDEALEEVKPARGEHNPAAKLGFDPLPPDEAVRSALEEAITALTASARSELRALMWVGRGDYAAKDWDRALADAAAVHDSVTLGVLLEQADLQSFLTKGLYELKLV